MWVNDKREGEGQLKFKNGNEYNGNRIKLLFDVLIILREMEIGLKKWVWAIKMEQW